MPKHYLRLTFYGRETPIQVAIGDVDTQDVLSAVKGLAAGGKDIQAFYVFSVSEHLSALISMAEIQTLQFTARPNGGVWTPPAVSAGVAFYLKGRRDPLLLDYSGQGPLDDMFHGLASTRYGEDIPGCIMLTDGEGEPSFFRLDEVQYALVRTELIQKPS
jgi:hypothetical protein